MRAAVVFSISLSRTTTARRRLLTKQLGVLSLRSFFLPCSQGMTRQSIVQSNPEDRYPSGDHYRRGRLRSVAGFFLPKPAHALVPFAKLYVALLSMSMLPILVTALTWGIGQMLRNATTRALFPRMALSYLLLLLKRSGGAGVRWSQPGQKPGRGRRGGTRPAARQRAGGRSRQSYHGVPAGHGTADIFAALSGAQFISIVFFCVLLGWRSGSSSPRC